jgi:hypothetical protein
MYESLVICGSVALMGYASDALEERRRDAAIRLIGLVDIGVTSGAAAAAALADFLPLFFRLCCAISSSEGMVGKCPVML